MAERTHLTDRLEALRNHFRSGATRPYVARREADLIINIVDASNLERNLYLTSQLLEMKVPMLVALNARIPLRCSVRS